jgi:glycosyltransferase involved in cell wall biosynthesis
MFENRNLKILFVFKGSILADSAPVNRILSIANCLSITGYQIYIYSILPSKKKAKTYVRKNGRLISILLPMYSWLPNKIVLVYGLLFIFPWVLVNKKPKIVYSYGESYILAIYLKLLKAIFRFKLIHEQNEYPLLILKKHSILLQPIIKLIINSAYKSIDGLIVITETLYNYYKPLLSSYSKIVVINMTVDFSRFENIDSISPYPNNFIITYCGSFDNEKDGILYLIEAFNNVLQVHKDVKLVLIGSGTNDENSTVNLLVKKLNIENSVLLISRLSKELVPLYLTHSSLLVLPRPSSMQANGGFPTKLGEYLATGNPVIVTNVGEISRFLVDKKSAFIIVPNSVQMLSEAILSIRLDYSNSLKVGREGLKVAKLSFSNESQTKKLKDFFDLFL